MANYVLRDLPDPLWDRVKARAEQLGWPLRPLFVQLLTDFADGHIAPQGSSPMAAYGWLTTYFRDLSNRDPGFETANEDVQFMKLRKHLLENGPPEDRPLVMSLTKLDPLRWRAVVKWLRNSASQSAKEPPPPVSLKPASPRVRTQTAVIVFGNNRETRIQNVARAQEGELHLVLYDAASNPLGRIALGDIASWFLED